MVTWGMDMLLKEKDVCRVNGEKSGVGPPHGPRLEPSKGHPGAGSIRVCEFADPLGVGVLQPRKYSGLA